MKIGIYSDLHLSRTSSIMPLYTSDSGKYTTRLNMIINTAKWMYKLFDEQGVDIIVNCGDTLDSNSATAEEITALYKFYEQSSGIKEYHIVGNHEMSDNGKSFYSTYLLKAFNFITLIDKPNTEIMNGVNISFLPYHKTEDINYDMIKSIKGDILFSHIDIKGSTLRGSYIMDTGVEPEFLAENFKHTINGHLHTPEIIKTTKNTVQNIGSVSSISFVDSNTYIPSVCIIDTDTYKVERFNNIHAILFRKFSVDNTKDLISKLKTMNGHKYIIDVSCPYEIKDELKGVITKFDNIISSRVVANSSKGRTDTVVSGGVSADTLNDINIKEEFKTFIKSPNIEKVADLERYYSVLGIEV